MILYLMSGTDHIFFSQIYSLKPELQLELFTALRDSLTARGILQLQAP